MSEAHAHEHPHPNYMAVFYALFAITVAEVAVTYVGLSEWMLIVILVLMALVKAALVAAYFMHLKYDNKVLTVIAATPLLLVAIALAVLSFEYTNYTPTATSATSNAKPIVPHGEGGDDAGDPAHE
ncbi:MAG: cytochrome C oxidase subunit IV family protein [bacterium]|nr:cytochrome C oxidase subunit IV family protein [Candidatus Kapabacteria bacterium]